MTSSIDGLVSGLSTSSLISSLMQVEAAPQTRLKTKVSDAQTVVGAFQSVNTKLAALKSAGDDLSQLTTWRAIKATSTSTAVTATAAGGLSSTTGSVTFDVLQLSRAQTSTLKVVTGADLDFDGHLDSTPPPITAAASIDITIGADPDTGVMTGTPVTITLGTDKSAQGVATAINEAGIGVKASVVKISETESILQFSGTKTGAANAFEVSGLNGAGVGGTSPLRAVAPQDAKIQVGNPNDPDPSIAAAAYTVRSASNTFTGLLPGVTLTANKAENGVTVNANADVAGLAAKFQTLVDAANAALSEVSKQTAYNPDTRKGSPLTGDFMSSQITSGILSMVSQGLGKLDPADADDFGSLSKIGIQLNRDGQLTFNAATFTAKYNEDPDTVKAAGMLLGDTVEALAGKQSDGITAAITGRKSLIDSMNDQIDNWSVRLSARQEALQKQYATLETSLSKLKSQSSWLSGQISGLG